MSENVQEKLKIGNSHETPITLAMKRALLKKTPELSSNPTKMRRRFLREIRKT